jgi:hypothetical protein
MLPGLSAPCRYDAPHASSEDGSVLQTLWAFICRTCEENPSTHCVARRAAAQGKDLARAGAAQPKKSSEALSCVATRRKMADF